MRAKDYAAFKANPEKRVKANINNIRNFRRNKMEALNHYGWACVCCGETAIELLTFDHINNDGAQHRKEIGSGTRMYVWLKNNGYPAGIQILCFNCNCSKGFHGYCPHNTPESERVQWHEYL